MLEQELPSKINILTINHQDGLIEFSLTNGGYTVENNGITISIETDNVNNESFPPCAYICIINHPLKGDLRVGDVFECEGGMNQDPDESVKACGYFSFHADRIFVKFTIAAINDKTVVFDLKSDHNDVNYYDSRAKDCSTIGRFSLTRKDKSNIWVPI